ncbi:MAG: hypothetical protein JWO79_1188 [Actinomycetia bacterium]|jgi:hypothetical protein|nr:hypothetical protein [Actinomycetes bacterium]MDQ1654952.1 hypothetical protein [Cryptosporangiaceae bacterium]
MATLVLARPTWEPPLARRAEALFVSPLQPSEEPDVRQVRTAIGASFRTFGGAAGCAAQCAAEFGEHPEVAVARMRWALALACDPSASN